MQRQLSRMNRSVRAAGIVLAASIAAATAGCLAGTVPVPVQPGSEALPSGNLRAREDLALAQLSMVRNAEQAHLAMNGKYATTPELMKAGLINSMMQGGQNYTVDVTVTDDGAKFFAMAVPVEYGPTGRTSFYLDETGVIRGADHQGGAAKPDDPVVQAQ